MATLLNLPPPPLDKDETLPGSEGPGTPMSGISTVAIKDGHEGTRPTISNLDFASERLSRLTSVTPGASANSSYFGAAATGGDFPSVSRTTSSDGWNTPSSEAGVLAEEPSRRSIPSSPLVSRGARPQNQQQAQQQTSQQQQQQQTQPLQQHLTTQRRGANSSPASSTATTASTAEARREAKMIDGMTYDEGVVDTTDRSPVPVVCGATGGLMNGPAGRVGEEGGKEWGASYEMESGEERN